MFTKTNKKTIFSTVSPFMKLLFIIPVMFLCLAQYSTPSLAADGDLEKAERTPLLVNGNSGDSVQIPTLVPAAGLSKPAARLSRVEVDRTPIATVNYEASIKNQVGKELAEKQYGFFSDLAKLLNVQHGATYYPQLVQKYQAEAGKTEVTIAKEQDLIKYLADMCWTAISKQPTLGGYLKDRRVQTESLITALESFIKTDTSLRARQESLLLAIDEYLSTIADYERQIGLKDERIGTQDQTIESLNQTIESLRSRIFYTWIIGLPVGVVIAFGGVLLGHYVWR